MKLELRYQSDVVMDKLGKLVPELRVFTHTPGKRKIMSLVA